MAVSAWNFVNSCRTGPGQCIYMYDGCTSLNHFLSDQVRFDHDIRAELSICKRALVAQTKTANLNYAESKSKNSHWFCENTETIGVHGKCFTGNSFSQ